MRVKVTLICEECLSRNYQVTKNRINYPERIAIKKYCPKCNKHTIHKETK